MLKSIRPTVKGLPTSVICYLLAIVEWVEFRFINGARMLGIFTQKLLTIEKRKYIVTVYMKALSNL
jgi:hypothetical protein